MHLENNPIKPMPIGLALIYFLLPAFGFRAIIYYGYPPLLGLGLSLFQATVIIFTIPTAILLALSMMELAREGNLTSVQRASERLRLKRLSGKDWLWIVGGFLVGFLLSGLLGTTPALLIQAFPQIAPPDYFPPILNPLIEFSPDVLIDFVGGPLRGNWSVALLYGVILFFNIFGEEFWWRGIILPRQEQVHGRWAWLIHGLLWLGFHLPFYPWAIFSLMPICLILSFVAQRLQNTWAAIVIHTFANGLPFLLILIMVLGLL